MNHKPSTITHSSTGFTLMELLTVMAILFILMGMTLAAYFGVLRSTAVQGAQENLHKVLALARQHAMTHRMRTYVIFRQESSGFQTNASYRVVAQAGTHAGDNNIPSLVVASPRWEENSLTGGTVYNLTAGSWAKVTGNTQISVVGALQDGTRNNWRYGDRYGWLIHDAEYLPTTLMFTDSSGNADTPDTIVFLPDGSTERGGSSDYEIIVREVGRETGAEFRIVVRGLTGLTEAPQEM